ncbi:hypothetical protein Q2T41_02645 [Maribacter confluentis]|uniref:Uncharacterized protein n=1 Tax=Maribacter confluentis TaxID=1656093 RepID=A0ABT8RKT4_9FLAO|nr:hypothetical protein [Maribacter confluentis]MDO1511565.1 hypothetical protein [Maribacter confluentis]
MVFLILAPYLWLNNSIEAKSKILDRSWQTAFVSRINTVFLL